MTAEFGMISNYVVERGFGFVRGLIGGTSSDIFFHIKTIKRTNPQLAAMLVESKVDDCVFWFEIEETPKGKQVRQVLTSQDVQRGAIQDPSRLISGIEALWRNINCKKPDWLEGATTDLLGHSRTRDLEMERDQLETERRMKLEAMRKEVEARQQADKERLTKQIEAKKAEEELKERELESLVDEVKQMGFSESSQVSNYIVTRQLGLKYRNISGVLQMELDGRAWDFKGGFPPTIYARLCEALGLSNQGTRARAVSFESFDSLEKRSRKK